jgi:hypothetical protein
MDTPLRLRRASFIEHVLIYKMRFQIRLQPRIHQVNILVGFTPGFKAMESGRPGKFRPGWAVSLVGSKSVAQILKKLWPHALVFAAMSAYFLFAPVVNARFFHHSGSPLSANVELPGSLSKGRFSVESLLFAGSGAYSLNGWAFPSEKWYAPSLQNAERQVVLSSPSRYYIFPAEPVYRLDVDRLLGAEGLDLKWSGFSSLIYKDSLAAGTYRVALLYFDEPGGSASLIDTGACVTRTPNHLDLSLPNPGSTCKAFYDTESDALSDGVGSPRLNMELPAPTDQAKYGMERLEPENQGGLFRLSGWAVLTIDPAVPASRYARRIVLLRAGTNLVFRTSVLARPDVEDRFPDIPANLTMSGFSALIDPARLDSGAYQLGVVFIDRKSGEEYFSLTENCVNRVAQGLELLPAGAADCVSN